MQVIMENYVNKLVENSLPIHLEYCTKKSQKSKQTNTITVKHCLTLFFFQVFSNIYTAPIRNAMQVFQWKKEETDLKVVIKYT